MEHSAIDKVTKKIKKQFPEMSGVRPTVKSQKSPSRGESQYLLTYKGKAILPGGRTLNRIVRVVADPAGRVLRISTSR
jgi:hypothetical protein